MLATLLIGLFAAGCGTFGRAVTLDDRPRLGPAAAPTEIVVFSDFACSFCLRAAGELDRLHRTRGNRVTIVFKHFPLRRHAEALPAARAAEAARLQGRFFEMHDQLFAHQAELGPALYEELAAGLGLDGERFRADLASAAVSERIAADVAEGEALGVDGTPWFLVNGRPFHGSSAELVTFVDGRLRR